MNKKDNFSDHKLLDTKGIMKKCPTLIASLSNFNFCQKMGVALPRPLGRPNIAEKNPEIFAEGI